MNSTELVNFKINLSSEWFRLPCHAIISIDEEVIEDIEVAERGSRGEICTVSFSKQLTEGSHQLKIRYLDKEIPDTRIDADGNITDDHLLSVRDIEIDEIELGHLIYSLSRFYPDRNVRPDLPEEMREIVCLGYNGTWVLDIEVPTYIWFLENL